MEKRKNNIYVFIFIGIFIVLLAVILTLYTRQFNYNLFKRDIYTHNISFNEFNRNLKGNELISLINFTKDYNNKDANKDSNVMVEIQLNDESTVSMDAILKLGIDEFLIHLGEQNFEISEREFYDNGKVSLMRYKLLDIESLNNEEGILDI